MKDKKGMMIMINLLLLVMTIALLAALSPVLNTFLNIPKQSDALNCAGFNHTTDNTLSYNASLDSDTIACLILKLYLPYIFIGILIMGAGNLFANRPGFQQEIGRY